MFYLKTIKDKEPFGTFAGKDSIDTFPTFNPYMLLAFTAEMLIFYVV